MTDQPSTQEGGRRPRRFFWRYDDGAYVYTGLYLWRGYFGGVVRLSGRRGSVLLTDLLKEGGSTR